MFIIDSLFTWNKPAYAFLATRIETGTTIQAQTLRSVESAEQVMMEMGFSDFRVRVFHGAARIQLPQEQFALAFQKQREIQTALKNDFSAVLLDLNPR